MSKNPLKQEVLELNRLYSVIVSVCGSYNKMGLEEKELAKKTELIKNGIEQDESIVSMLKESNKRISEELNAAKENYGDLKASMKEVEGLVIRLEKMDSIQAELAGSKRNNTSLRLKLMPFSAKVWKFQEVLFRLQKEKKQVLKDHSELMKKKDAFTSLAPKVLPSGELLGIKDKLVEETSRSEDKSKEIGKYKEELVRLVPLRDDMRQELDTISEKYSSVQEHISSMEVKVNKLTPKIMPEEEIKRLSDDLISMREKRRTLAEEKKELSPRMASIAEEDENLSSILESYQLKNKKDKDRLETLKKEQKKLDIDKDAIDKLREKASTIDIELEGKRREHDSLKKEYSEVTDANQKYKRIIDEVERKTKKLKGMITKKK